LQRFLLKGVSAYAAAASSAAPTIRAARVDDLAAGGVILQSDAPSSGTRGGGP
jgi:hypothetical protein